MTAAELGVPAIIVLLGIVIGLLVWQITNPTVVIRDRIIACKVDTVLHPACHRLP